MNAAYKGAFEDVADLPLRVEALLAGDDAVLDNLLLNAVHQGTTFELAEPLLELLARAIQHERPVEIQRRVLEALRILAFHDLEHDAVLDPDRTRQKASARYDATFVPTAGAWKLDLHRNRICILYAALASYVPDRPGAREAVRLLTERDLFGEDWVAEACIVARYNALSAGSPKLESRRTRDWPSTIASTRRVAAMAPSSANPIDGSEYFVESAWFAAMSSHDAIRYEQLKEVAASLREELDEWRLLDLNGIFRRYDEVRGS